MLSSVNPYGLGNVYTQNIQPNTKESQPSSTQNIQDSQELPNLSKETLEIRKFSDGVKGANEMVGAMQIADITLNALSTQAKDMGEINPENLNILDKTAKAAQFRNEALFGRELSLNLAGENVSLSLPLPSQMAQDNSSLIESLSQKHNEISDKMSTISTLIEKASLPLSNNTQNYDFENFDTNSFKNLFQ